MQNLTPVKHGPDESCRPRPSRPSRWFCLSALAIAALGGLLVLHLRAGGAQRVPAQISCPGRTASRTDIARSYEPSDDRSTVARPLVVAVGEPQPLVQLCQALSPAAPYPVRGIDCVDGSCAIPGWNAAWQMNWQPYGQGEYVGHERTPHVPSYRLRVNDVLELVYRITRDETPDPYQFNIGDELSLESSTDRTLNRNLIVQPDGTITLKLIGQVQAMHQTVNQLRGTIEQLYKTYYKVPEITVTPLKMNTKLEDIRATVDRRFGFGGQSRAATVTPEGTIALPAIGSVPVQGLTLEELKRELDERYDQEVEGLEVTPILTTRAPRFVFIVGEVHTPGRYELVAPTTLMQAISLAGGWNVGANLRQVTIFRRGDDWRLLAAMLDIRGALYGKIPCPADEVWINDSDVVVVPKSPIRVFDDYVRLIFTQGLWSVMPFYQTVSFNIQSTL